MDCGAVGCHAWGPGIRERLARQVCNIRHWSVVCGSYADLDVSRDATWFVDPPYVDAGRHYRHGSSGVDYGHLADWCRSLPGQVMVCENRGASWLPFEDFATIAGTNGSGRSGRSHEVLWLQG